MRYEAGGRALTVAYGRIRLGNAGGWSGFAPAGNGDKGVGAPSRRLPRQGGVMYIGIGALVLIVILLLILT